MKVSDEQIIQAVEQTTNLSEAARLLGVHLSSLVNRTKKLGVHRPNQGRKGCTLGKHEREHLFIPLEEILEGKHSQYTTSGLKSRLIKSGIFAEECQLCKAKPSSFALILDHINGINNDHRRENLRFLCPNCNASLPTHAGRNRKTKPKPKTDEVMILEILSGDDNRRILERLGMVANGANYRRIDRLRTVIEIVQKHASMGE